MCVGVCMWRARSGDYIGIFSSLSKVPRLSVIIVCPRCMCACVCVHVHGADTSVGVSCFIVFDSRPMIAIGIC